MTGEAGTGPAVTLTVTEANDDPVQAVTLQLVNKANDKLLTWYNGTLEVKVDVTSTAGTIAINDGEAGAAGADATFNQTFENGEATFLITLGGTWAENDTIKVTVDDSDTKVMGYTVEKNAHYLLDVDADPVEEGGN